MLFTDHFYRPCVGAVMINRRGLIFMGTRKDDTSPNPYWQLPQGGMDPNEDYEAALLRELKEEIDTNAVSILRTSESFAYYDVPETMRPDYWKVRNYIGQKQKWFLCEFMGQDQDINLNTHEPEFNNWQWNNGYFLLNHAYPYKKEVYYDILNQFKLI